jgi:hypothetical protein
MPGTLKIGDRVRLREPVAGQPAGAEGVVTGASSFPEPLYLVAFPHAETLNLREDALEVIAGERAVAGSSPAP